MMCQGGNFNARVVIERQHYWHIFVKKSICVFNKCVDKTLNFKEVY